MSLTQDKLLLIVKLQKFCNDFRKRKYKIINKSGEVFESPYLFFYCFLMNKEIQKSKYIKLVVEGMERAERVQPGSSLFFIENICALLTNRTLPSVTKNLNVSSENIRLFFKETTFNDNYIDVLNVISFIGPDGSIDCKFTKNDTITCERSDFSSFSIATEKSLDTIYFSAKNKVKNNFFVTICDTFIERETDVLPAIEKAFESKRHLVLFCRGMTANVANVLKSIMLKNNMLIYVYVDSFDQNDPFKFKDISSCLNVPVLSPDSCVSIVRNIGEYTCYVENLTLKSNMILIDRVDSGEVKLIDQNIKGNSDKSLIEYLRFRKNRLSCKVAVVYMPEDEKKLMQDFKDIIRCYNNIIKTGIIMTNSGLRSKKCFNNINELSNAVYRSISQTSLVIKEV